MSEPACSPLICPLPSRLPDDIVSFLAVSEARSSKSVVSAPAMVRVILIRTDSSERELADLMVGG